MPDQFQIGINKHVGLYDSAKLENTEDITVEILDMEYGINTHKKDYKSFSYSNINRDFNYQNHKNFNQYEESYICHLFGQVETKEIKILGTSYNQTLLVRKPITGNEKVQ